MASADVSLKSLLRQGLTTTGVNGTAGGDGDKPPPDDKEDIVIDDPLERKGRPFAGLIRDVKRRWALGGLLDCVNTHSEWLA